MVKAAKAACTEQRVPIRNRRPDCPRDLAAIVHQCLQQSPADRYQSVQELSEDLHCFLRGAKVKARALSLPERARRLVRRNRGLAVVFAFAMGSLMAGATVSFLLWRRADRTALPLRKTVLELRASRDKINTEWTLRNRSSLNHTLASADRNWRMSPDLVREWLDDATRSRPGPASFAENVQRHRTQRVIREIKTGTYSIIDLSYSPDESHLATVGTNGYVRCWDLSTGKFIWQRRLGIQEVRVCRFHPGGDQILIIDKGQLKLLDSKTGDTVQAIESTDRLAHSASFSPPGNLIAVWNRSNLITVWDSQLSQVLQQFDLPLKDLATIGITQDELTVYAIANNGKVILGDIPSGELSISNRKNLSQIHAAAFSSRGKHFAISRRHGGLRVFRSVDDEAPYRLATGPERIDGLSFSRRGDWLLSGNRRRIEARHENAGWEKRWTRQVGAVTNVIRFSPQSEHYAIGLSDGRVQHCSLTAPRIDHVIHSGVIRPRKLCIDPDRGSAVVAGASVEKASLTSDEDTTVYSNTGDSATDMTLSLTTGDLFLATGKKRQLLTCRMGSESFHETMTFTRSVRVLALDEVRQRLAVGLAGGAIKLIRTSDDTTLNSIPTGHAHISALAFEPKTGRLACGNDDGEIIILDSNSQPVSRVQAHQGPVTKVTFSSDGKHLASTSHDRRVRIIDIDNTDNKESIKQRRERERTLSFSH